MKITELYGVGEKRAADFEKRSIYTVSELLTFFPRAYEDRTAVRDISDIGNGETALIKAIVMSPVKVSRIRANMTLYTITAADDSGIVKIVFYNNKYVKNAFHTGESFVFFGKMAVTRYSREMQNPIYERSGSCKYTERIVPIYPLSGKLTQKLVINAMENALKTVAETEDYLPAKLREKYKLAEYGFSVRNIHFPADLKSCEAARRRFVFEELFFLQLALAYRRRNTELLQCKPFTSAAYMREFADRLPFPLTNAQKRVMNEISADMHKGHPMSRLVQGDVGSGKTVVAAAAMYAAVKNGCQAAIMAPTEILAAQHYETFSELLKDSGVKICLLTGSVKGKKKLASEIENGGYDIIIGTHAIIQKEVKYKNLGLAVVDEQHRFGVSQRADLVNKSKAVHTLVMTATPIPRTLSFILYGDLDISVIDELPPGRKPVATYAVGEDMRSRVYRFLDKSIKSGMQAYVICPLIEETEGTDLKNVCDVRDRLAKTFPYFAVGLLHGKMKSAEKEAVMTEFVSGKINILVSTTVIEVGVNVVNSNIMIIENAERFGLSQLHQLRGRVGRGHEKAYCIMLARDTNEVTKKRMEIMCKSNDGFYISEQDLQLRGPGDFFGTRQHGLPEMRIANLFRDRDVLSEAQAAAKEILEKDPELSAEENKYIRARVLRIFDENIAMN